MARRTYERREGVSPVFHIPFTEWTVRNEEGRKLGTIRKDGEQFSAYSGRYDTQGNFISSSSGRLCATYKQAQAWFRG